MPARGRRSLFSSLEGCPPNIDYYYNKHLMETVVFEKVMHSEAAGFDAVVVGCCYDPGVRVARELVDIPVIGPLEASMQMAGYFGHSYTVVTDHHKAVPYLEDLVRLYGLGGNCRGVRCIDWWVKDMVNDPDAVALRHHRGCAPVLAETRAEVDRHGLHNRRGLLSALCDAHKGKPEVVIVNPNLLALKMAESLADLKQGGSITWRAAATTRSRRDTIASSSCSSAGRSCRRSAWGRRRRSRAAPAIGTPIPRHPRE